MGIGVLVEDNEEEEEEIEGRPEEEDCKVDGVEDIEEEPFM